MHQGYFMKTIINILQHMKHVVVRVDWNIPIQNGVILDNSRLLETLPTLMRLLDKDKHITILTHLGRPNGSFQTDLSLKILLPEMESLLQTPIHFIDLEAELGQQWSNRLSLFENVRFYPGEDHNDAEFAEKLALNADVFVNDAFSVSHRAHASVEGITHHLPHCAGLLMERELTNLIHFHDSYESPLMAICGGAKISTKIDFIQNMLKKAHSIALVGGLANTFLKAKGLNVGDSLVENDALELARRIMDQAEHEGCQLWMPDYVRVGKHLDDTPIEKAVTDLESDDRILDIAPNSLNSLLNTLEAAKTIIWNGALGVFEKPQWADGTLTLATELAGLTQAGTVKTLAGGGETVMALRQSNTFNDLTYVSLAGGAFMEFMEGRQLPGILPLM